MSFVFNLNVYSWILGRRRFVSKSVECDWWPAISNPSRCFSWDIWHCHWCWEHFTSCWQYRSVNKSMVSADCCSSKFVISYFIKCFIKKWRTVHCQITSYQDLKAVTMNFILVNHRLKTANIKRTISSKDK